MYMQCMCAQAHTQAHTHTHTHTHTYIAPLPNFGEMICIHQL